MATKKSTATSSAKGKKPVKKSTSKKAAATPSLAKHPAGAKGKKPIKKSVLKKSSAKKVVATRKASPSKAKTRKLSITELRASFPGRVIAPKDADYDKARTVFYGGVDRHPAVIIKVADANEVAQVIA